MREPQGVRSSKRMCEADSGVGSIVFNVTDILITMTELQRPERKREISRQ